jgi:uncharacterized repeat protein (TIGR02543 family)
VPKPNSTALLFLLLCISFTFAQQLNSNIENQGLGCNVSSKPLLAGNGDPALPDPFLKHDGTRISSQSEWACKRNEVIKNLEQYEIGPKPNPESAGVEASLAGNTLTVKVTTSSGSINLTSNVSGTGPCISIGMNGNAGNISGCKSFAFNHDQVVKYAMNDTRNQSDPFYKVYPDLWNKVSNYAAWSWGISRLIDGIIQLKDQLGVDPAKIGIQGCSYAGKMALFGGALDERVTLTVVQESGGGGINAWRLSKAFTARTGTNIEKIDNTNYSWFLPSMKSLNPDRLPHDHHQLLALIAPRPVIVLGNPTQIWLGDESGYRSAIAARKVWEAFGAADRFGFDFAGGHNHCAASSTQSANVTAFVNKFLKDQTANTNISANRPTGNGQDNFQLDTAWTWAPLPKLTGSYGPGGCEGFSVTHSVVPAAAGSVTMDTEGNCHENGASVTLTATPKQGWVFDGWDGDASGTSTTAQITMNANKTVTAKFKVDGCPQYQPTLCGGAAFGDILDNTKEMPATGKCVFIQDFTQIEPAENSTVAINGTRRVCTTGWEADRTGDCGPVAKPAAKIDGGYYVYVEKGTINTYTPANATESNGWKGIVAGARTIPACGGMALTAKPAALRFSMQVLSNKEIRIESNSAATLEIFDLKGKSVANIRLITGSQTVKLALPAGIYLSKIRGMQTTQFMLK